MVNDTLTINTKHLLYALYASGVKHFVVSPGSRTTPIALMLAEYERQNSEIVVYIDVDERSAGFFALGIAKTRQEPVVVLGTSGTAITEYMPAVAEAKVSHIPLIVLSTDRPAELQDNGAPQTLPQHRLFGELTPYFVSFTLQDEHEDNTAYIDYMTQKLVHSAMDTGQPLQINLPLRKPLMPKLHDNHDVSITPLTFEKTHIHILPIVIKQTHVVILAGPNEAADYKDELLQFSRDHQVPVIADILSRARTTDTIFGVDSLIKAHYLTDEYRPDLVIRFGGTPVSARVLQWLQRENIPVWHVDGHAGNDHSRHVTRAFQMTPTAFLTQLALTNDMTFYQRWQQLNDIPRHAVGEASVSCMLNRILPENTAVFVANSMAIRDMDDVFSGRTTQKIYANRGVNGIDGVVSTALGMSTVSSQRSILLTGDLTLFHDMNGLMMAKKYQLNIDIIVINNNGGSIFSFLPQSQADEYFEDMFGTPLDLDMSKVAYLYDMPYIQLKGAAALGECLSHQVHGPRLIEINFDRQENVANHRELLELNQHE